VVAAGRILRNRALLEQRGHERVVSGYDNEVYRITLDSGSVVYARIQVGSNGDFSHEIWAMEQAQNAGAPVPAVLTVGSIKSRPAMIVAAARGRPLTEWLDTVIRSRRRVIALESVGRAPHVVNSIPVTGYGRPDESGRCRREAAIAHSGSLAIVLRTEITCWRRVCPPWSSTKRLPRYLILALRRPVSQWRRAIGQTIRLVASLVRMGVTEPEPSAKPGHWVQHCANYPSRARPDEPR
jgi:hypothetical protein